MLIVIFIVFIAILSIAAFVLLQKHLQKKEETNLSSLKNRLNYLQQDFAHQGALETRDEVDGTGPFDTLLNYLATLLPAPSPKKLDLLNKAGLREPNAYKGKVVEQLSTTVLGIVAGSLLGIIFDNPIIGIVGAAGLGFVFYIRAWGSLEAVIKKRSYYIDKSLPDLIDLFANACSAGTTFDLAADFIIFQLPESELTTAIKQDMLAWQQDIKYGVERQEAWTRLHQRSKSKNMKYFCNLIDQSEQTGGSISSSLLKMADFFRERRKQALEAEIAQLRGKLVMLTIIFIVLPILIYMIVPIGIQVAGQMKGIF